MNICVKYCGGCNPRYDRSKIIKKLQEDCKSINIITNRNSNETCDLVLILSGCMSSCVNHENLSGKYGKIVVKNLSDYKNLISIIDKIISDRI